MLGTFKVMLLEYISLEKMEVEDLNLTNHFKNVIINFSISLMNSKETWLQLTSNCQSTKGEKSIHQKANQFSIEIDKEMQQLATMHKIDS